MRLVFDKELNPGLTFPEAVQQLLAWYNQNADQYPVLKKSLDISFELEDFEGRPHEDNKQSFLIEGPQFYNVEVIIREDAISKFKQLFPILEMKAREDVKQLDKAIAFAERQHRNAIKKQWSSIYEWEAKIEKAKSIKQERYDELKTRSELFLKVLNNEIYKTEVLKVLDNNERLVAYAIRACISKEMSGLEKDYYIYKDGMSDKDYPFDLKDPKGRWFIRYANGSQDS